MRFCLLVALDACFLVSPAIAQRAPAPLPSPEEVETRDLYTVAVGAALIPDYEGSDDYRLIPAAAIRARIDGIAVTTNGSWIYVDLIRKHGKFSFDAGPIAGLRFDKRHDADDKVVKLLPSLNTAIELGAFAGVSFRGLIDPYDALAVHLDALHDVGNAHKSTILSPNVSYSTPLSRKTYVSASASVDFVDSRYARYYFAISPEASFLTAGVLPPFSLGGGIKSWKTSLLVNQSITGDLMHGFSVFGEAGYSNLLGDFRRSPLVTQRGSATQWAGAVGLAYTW